MNGKDKKKGNRLLTEEFMMSSDKKLQQQLVQAQGNKYKDYYGLKVERLNQASSFTPKHQLHGGVNLNNSLRANDSQNNSLGHIKKGAAKEEFLGIGNATPYGGSVVTPYGVKEDFHPPQQHHLQTNPPVSQNLQSQKAKLASIVSG